jgi:hypothetical protein
MRRLHYSCDVPTEKALSIVENPIFSRVLGEADSLSGHSEQPPPELVWFDSLRLEIYKTGFSLSFSRVLRRRLEPYPNFNWSHEEPRCLHRGLHRAAR